MKDKFEKQLQGSIIFFGIAFLAPVWGPFAALSYLIYYYLNMVNVHPVFIIVSVLLANGMLLYVSYSAVRAAKAVIVQAIGVIVYGISGYLYETILRHGDSIWGCAVAVIAAFLGYFLFTQIKSFVDQMA